MVLRDVKRDKLKKLREARKAGSSVLTYSDDEDEQIYDEVDETTYREHKRQEMMNDDFIVDDNGEGYVDNGLDEWDDSTRPNYYSDEEEEAQGKKRKKTKKPVKIAKTAQISHYFQSSKLGGDSGANKKKVNANIDDILVDFEDKKPTVAPFGKKSLEKQNKTKPKNSNPFSFLTSSSRSKQKAIEQKPREKKESSLEKSPSPALDNAPEIDTVDMEEDDIAEEPNPVKVEDPKVKVEKEDASSDDSDEDVIVTRRPRAVGKNRNNNVNFTSVNETKIKVNASSVTPSVPVSYMEKYDASKVLGADQTDDNTFKMFWLDYAEVDNTLILFGKVPTKDGRVVSGVLQIQDICKELYFLPRDYRLSDEADFSNEPVNPLDVHDEIVPLLLEKYGLDSIKAKPEKMKYAFELPGIPKEKEYLKVLLPFRTPKNRFVSIPPNLEGETFKHVFGGNAGIFESFVLQRNIMGPCWLEVTGADFNSIKNVSHCQVEVAVSSPEQIKPLTQKLDAPKLTLSSISIQTVLSPQQNKQEIVSVSLATYRDIPQDAPVDKNTPPNEIVTLVRPVGSVALPPGLTQLAQKQDLNLRTFPNEKSLLNCLAAIVKTTDPDVFLGHRLENISLDVLVHRMYDLKVTTWSAFGRRNRKVWPEKFNRNGGGFNNNLMIREIFQGRLLCDIANEMGQSLTPKCQSWDLNEMYEVICGKKLPQLEVNYQNTRYSDDANFLLIALRDNASNVRITSEIGFEIQILSLTKQLTNLAGNAWSHTLSGTRAGRNEFILLHEFKRNNYIVPDREDRYQKNSNNQQQAKLEANEDDATAVTSNKKPKYQGGLVFEPEKGLHKNYILVMDFNSLYPSIIQEFNICFTTVDRDQYNLTLDEDRDLPFLPDGESSQGVLPRLLNTLVSRRREVKKLLKDPKISQSEKAQYDIKQQALKLTANSMYGCLGYVNSRFYAKPLAMLVTNKGREILMDTRQLAESIGLRVVYGDTDSVMIDTGAEDLKEAIKIGEDFKVQVNERYKLLEIDIDNVFKRLLLHAKKKYAAMNVSIDKATGKERTILEVKGLDMRRREYCQLSKDISTYVLEKILSQADPEQALFSVYEYLEEEAKKIRNNEIPVDKFKINTRLSKDPNNYPNGKTMPPVQAALKLRKQGKVIKAGSVITYVITAKVSDDDSSSQADRAVPIQDVIRNKLRPDPDFYLEKQIFAPVERLLERIEGIEMIRIAEILGIDTRRYVINSRHNDSAGGDIVPIESSISDEERFRQASYLVLECKCKAKFRFGGIMASNDYQVTFNGIKCAKCGFTFPLIKLTSQLEVAIRKHITLYYCGWLKCDDASCGIETRQISVYGRRCLGASGKAYGCKGIMRYAYSDKALYNQLLYFDSIFDVNKAKKQKLKPLYESHENIENISPKIPSAQVEALAEQNRENFSACQDVVQKYLRDSGRRYVDMAGIFDFMGSIKS